MSQAVDPMPHADRLSRTVRRPMTSGRRRSARPGARCVARAAAPCGSRRRADEPAVVEEPLSRRRRAASGRGRCLAAEAAKAPRTRRPSRTTSTGRSRLTAAASRRPGGEAARSCRCEPTALGQDDVDAAVGSRRSEPMVGDASAVARSGHGAGDRLGAGRPARRHAEAGEHRDVAARRAPKPVKKARASGHDQVARGWACRS